MYFKGYSHKIAMTSASTDGNRIPAKLSRSYDLPANPETDDMSMNKAGFMTTNHQLTAPKHQFHTLCKMTRRWQCLRSSITVGIGLDMQMLLPCSSM
mmetsp:Transcript_28060/g.82550  ORF Transcript_28060/g.82550 Transcript_28060/m.82550 type:complete len:97 (-) Transcript_28060:188-478(-)